MNELSFEEKVLNEIRNIKDRLERLENANRPFAPTIPNMPQVITQPTFNCSKCKLVMNGAMGYCCPHKDCPTGMGPVTCSVK